MSAPQAFWGEIFGCAAPVEIEIGPERGAFLMAAAAASPQRNFLGIERSPNRVARLEAALRTTSRPNVRVLCGDAACVVGHCVPHASVAEYHIYFPDPWWKRRHGRRRLLTPELAADLAATLEPGGRVHLVTDVAELFAYAAGNLGSVPGLRQGAEMPTRPIRTTFEGKALERGAALHCASFVRD